MGRYLFTWFLLYWTDRLTHLNSLIPILKTLEILNEGPILIHVKQRGKVTLFAEYKERQLSCGVSKFNVKTGEQVVQEITFYTKSICVITLAQHAK